MALWHTLAISQSGMQVEELRMQTAAKNIAMANIPQVAGQAALKPWKVMAQQQAVSPFYRLFAGESARAPAFNGVSAYVMEQSQPPRQVLDPQHPMANAQGYVEYPAVNAVEEMMAMTMAVRAYEANVTAFNAAKAMATKALDIGGQR
ncbi:flagellar basal body rod protein FlgC [Neisseriaceae bacterium TC5R-5]|nr:flagellar basal body rod protein FlgC [Neisseriaceae bacterium TC5R-5]